MQKKSRKAPKQCEWKPGKESALKIPRPERFLHFTNIEAHSEKKNWPGRHLQSGQNQGQSNSTITHSFIHLDSSRHEVLVLRALIFK
jgi:hypothetical protein